MEEEWTVKRILEWIEGFLREKGDGNPRLSAQWLVADVLECTRIELYVSLDKVLTQEQRDVLRDYTRRRAGGEPLQYITGTTDFRFVTLSVRPGVLIPRPETEVLVSEALAAIDELAQPETADVRTIPDSGALESATLVSLDDAGLFLQLDEGEPIPVALDADGDVVLRETGAGKRALSVVDLCTGSGNIACSIASELVDAHVVATDVSPLACALARDNVRSLGLEDRVRVIECDLGEEIDRHMDGTVDLVVSNPPYIPSAELTSLDSEVADFEPVLALDGGADGLDVFRRILPLSLRLLKPGGMLAVELHESCLDKALDMACSAGFDRVRVVHDLADRQRVLVARKPC
ncbi:MAG: peptide chain release factor N(5)-glutamine methyltransferase [Eggerthellaceae bacterium]|nr:peptide chain release factor N(5)-glutamine methyltransferase [Eggerthellaceae bacterium]